MSATELALDKIRNDDLSDDEIRFVVAWDNKFFGRESAAEDLGQAAVQWRILARCGDTLVGHVAISDMQASVNDAFPATVAIGRLFTHSEFQGKGIGNSIMDAAERFVFNDKGAELILLFCLDSLREFYAGRGWRVLTEPVLLEQSNDWVVWSDSTMGLSQTDLKIDDYSVRVKA